MNRTTTDTITRSIPIRTRTHPEQRSTTITALALERGCTSTFITLGIEAFGIPRIMTRFTTGVGTTPHIIGHTGIRVHIGGLPGAGVGMADRTIIPGITVVIGDAGTTPKGTRPIFQDRIPVFVQILPGHGPTV